MSSSFTVVVERDPETHWLVGEVVEPPGCYTQAPDLPALQANIREADELTSRQGSLKSQSPT